MMQSVNVIDEWQTSKLNYLHRVFAGLLWCVLLTFCRVNCSFYFKIGACRHGDRCSRMHNRPTYGQAILLQNLFLNPQHAPTSAQSMCISCLVTHMPRWQLTQSLTLYGHIKTTEQRPLYSNTVMYTGHWWVGCYIWYSEEGPGWTEAPPSFLLAVPTVTVHPSTASVHTSCGTIIASGL